MANLSIVNTEKYITFPVPITRKLDNGKSVAYKKSLLIALDLCEAHYQVLLIIYLKKFLVISALIANLDLTI